MTSYETNYIESKRRIEQRSSGASLPCRSFGMPASSGDVCSIVVGVDGTVGVWTGSGYVE